MAKRILITGGAGFIGSHFVEHVLRSTDWDIVVLDALHYAANGKSRLNRLDDALTKFDPSGRCALYTCDLRQPLSVGVKKEIGAVDYIVHMAAETHVDNSITDPRPFVESNVLGTFEMLQLARSLPDLRQFVYFSTDEVFGPAARGMVATDARTDSTRLHLFDQYREWDRYNSTNPYSASKAAGEELCLAWANTYKVPVLVTHTMNVIGERQHPEKFVPKCVRSILQGEPMTIHSDPQRERAGSRFYIHARNVAAAVLYLLEQGPFPRDKFNIVGEQEVSNLDMLLKIGEILQRPARYQMVDFHSSRPGHDLRYALSGEKLAALGWKPPVSFEESLAKTVQWMVNPDNLAWLLLGHAATV